VKIEINEEFNVNMIVQYRDVNKTIDFLLEHSSFASNLVYVSIRQYNDENVRIYNEMQTTD
jgi:hypothetical protein